MTVQKVGDSIPAIESHRMIVNIIGHLANNDDLVIDATICTFNFIVTTYLHSIFTAEKIIIIIIKYLHAFQSVLKSMASKWNNSNIVINQISIEAI